MLSAVLVLGKIFGDKVSYKLCYIFIDITDYGGFALDIN